MATPWSVDLDEPGTLFGFEVEIGVIELNYFGSVRNGEQQH